MLNELKQYIELTAMAEEAEKKLQTALEAYDQKAFFALVEMLNVVAKRKFGKTVKVEEQSHDRYR